MPSAAAPNALPLQPEAPLRRCLAAAAAAFAGSAVTEAALTKLPIAKAAIAEAAIAGVAIRQSYAPAVHQAKKPAPEAQHRSRALGQRRGSGCPSLCALHAAQARAARAWVRVRARRATRQPAKTMMPS